MSETLIFTKMHGTGNDYIYIDCFKNSFFTIDYAHKYTNFLSDRHFGIGGDGVILIMPSDKADARMRMFNADGSEGEMCGNGLRCVAKYVYDHITKKDTLKIETGRGVLDINVETKNSKAFLLTVNMGEPILNGLEIPTTIDKNPVVNEPIIMENMTYHFTAVSMGNPHAVIYVDDVDKFPVERIGKQIENNKIFPNKVNVEFVEVISKNEIKQRTWERGTGETYACGTGASAVCVAGALTGRTESNILNHLLGGDLELKWEGRGKPVFMKGKAVEIYKGTIELN